MIPCEAMRPCSEGDAQGCGGGSFAVSWRASASRVRHKRLAFGEIYVRVVVESFFLAPQTFGRRQSVDGSSTATCSNKGSIAQLARASDQEPQRCMARHAVIPGLDHRSGYWGRQRLHSWPLLAPAGEAQWGWPSEINVRVVVEPDFLFAHSSLSINVPTFIEGHLRAERSSQVRLDSSIG